MREWRYSVNLYSGNWCFSRQSMMIIRYKRGGAEGRVNLNDVVNLAVL